MTDDITQPFVVKDNQLIARVWMGQGEGYQEFATVRRESGRIAWLHFPAMHANKRVIHAEFDRMNLLGEPYANDYYRPRRFADYTATWAEKLTGYQFVDDILRIIRKQPIYKHLKQLRAVLVDFPSHERHWTYDPKSQTNNDFADFLLIHINAVLAGAFEDEFFYRYKQPMIPASATSAAGELFKKIEGCILNEKGFRRA